MTTDYVTTLRAGEILGIGGAYAKDLLKKAGAASIVTDGRNSRSWLLKDVMKLKEERDARATAKTSAPPGAILEIVCRAAVAEGDLALGPASPWYGKSPDQIRAEWGKPQKDEDDEQDVGPEILELMEAAA